MGWLERIKNLSLRGPNVHVAPELENRIEALEERMVLVSGIIPGTLLAGPDWISRPDTLDVPPQPDGAVGTQFLVSVVNNRVFWRPKDGVTDPANPSTAPVEVNIINFFRNQAVQTNGDLIFTSTGTVLPAFDDTPYGLSFDTGQDPAVLITEPGVTIGAYVAPAGEPRDARCFYDSYFGRFVVSATDVAIGDHSVTYIGVSRSENPNDGWYFVSVNTEFSASITGRDATGNLQNLIDFYVANVNIGLTSNTILFTGNAYGVSGDTIVFGEDARMYGVQKQRLYEGSIGGAWSISPAKFDYRDMTSGPTVLNLTPAINSGDDANNGFVLTTLPDFLVDTTVFNGFRVIRITNADNGNRDVFADLTGVFNASIQGYTFDPPGFNEATAPSNAGGTTKIDLDFQNYIVADDAAGSFDISFFPLATMANPPRAVWVANPDIPGFGSLWTTNTLDRPNLVDQPEVRWYEMGAATTAIVPFGSFVVGTGLFYIQDGGVNLTGISGAEPGDPVDTYAPSIAVDRFNNMVLSFAASNPHLFIGAYYTGRFDADRFLTQWDQTTRPSKALQPGLDVYYRQFIGDGVPWGWYSGIGVDPVESGTFWTFNAYANIRPQDNLFGFWSTTWGAFRLLADQKIFAIDVSPSMFAVRNMDVNGDDVINSQDDLNGDGLEGTLIDLAIGRILQQVNDRALPGQDPTDNQGGVSLLIFSQTAAPVMVNLSPLAADPFIVNPGQQAIDSMTDFVEALKSIRLGSAGVRTESTVVAKNTLYAPIYNALQQLLLGTGVSQVECYSDGSGFLPTLFTPPLRGVRIDALTLGPYQTLGFIGDYARLAALSRGVLVTAATDPSLNPTPMSKSGIYDGGFVGPNGLPPDPKPFPTSVILPGLPSGLFPVQAPPATSPITNGPIPAAAAVTNAAPAVDSNTPPPVNTRRQIAASNTQAIDSLFSDPDLGLL